MNQLLQQLITTAPLFIKYTQQDIAIGISDTEKYLAFFETDEMKFPYAVGDSIRNTEYVGVIDSITKTRTPVEYIVPKEITGTVTNKTVVYPIVDNDEVVGFISTSINIDKEKTMEDISVSLRDSISYANESIHDIVKSAESLNNMIESIIREIEKLDKNIDEGNTAMQLIQGISKQSNLLSLNASIEAVRVGSLGSGFAIVATEMRKMAEQTKTISGQVEESLKLIKLSAAETINQINKVKEVSAVQYEATEAISKSLEDINVNSENLVEVSKS